MNNILFFDTETNGLPKDWKKSASEVDNWPRIMQFAFMIYSPERELLSSGKFLVKPPEGGFKAEPGAVATNGLSDEICESGGILSTDMIGIFKEALRTCGRMVAHNIKFDWKIVRSEFMRHGEPDPKDESIKWNCTMMESTKFCAILPDGKSSFKWPKLQELHTKLFGCEFDGAHDAMADIQATAKCFWELVDRKVISLT